MTHGAPIPETPSLVRRHDPETFAEVIGLRWVRSDELPCIRRRRAGRGFTYWHTEKGPIRRGHPERARLDALAVPPAWEQVWICEREDGHLQATGRDARGRKQYRYHPIWSDRRREFHDQNLVGFAWGLPELRRVVAATLEDPQPDESTMHAAAVRVLDLTGVRLGGPRALRHNGTRRLTTWTLRQAELGEDRVEVQYRGKGGVQREVDITDDAVLDVLVSAAEHDEPRLFSYEDAAGEAACVTARSLNAFLQDHLGPTAHAHQFRAWRTTWLVLDGLRRSGARAGSVGELLDVLEPIAEDHGHTVAVARGHYLHAAVESAWLGQGLPDPVEGSQHMRDPDEDRALRTLIALLQR